MTKQRIVMAGLLALATLILSAEQRLSAGEAAAAAEPAAVAETFAVRRHVAASSDERGKRLLKIKTPVYLDEVVKCAPKARTQLLFADHSIVSLGSDCELSVANYVYDAQKKSGQLKVDVKRGAFRILGGALSKSKDGEVIIETPVATCGVRGSLVAGFYDHLKEILHVMVISGELTVKSKSDGKEVSVNTPGFGTSVGLDAPLSPAAALPLKNLAEAADCNPEKDRQAARDSHSGGADGGGGGVGSSGSGGSCP